MAEKRTALLSEIRQLKDQVRASERRGRRSTQKLRRLEQFFAALRPGMNSWVSLPVAEEAFARVMTTRQCRELLALLDAPTDPEQTTGDEDEQQV